MLPDTSYNRKLQQESMNKRKQEILENINALKTDLPTREGLSIVELMDLLEKVVKMCGGEAKLEFLDVGLTFIKAHTRVPLSANLFPFLDESEDNPRFHKIITQLLIGMKQTSGVRWVPTEDRGAYIIYSIKEGTNG